MRLSVQEFWLPKKGNPVEEYEDAFSHSLVDCRFAVADGATESAFADRWAKSLVSKFIAQPPFASVAAAELPQWLVPIQREWQEGIDWDHLPWFSESKARSGAFATIIGLEFSRAGSHDHLLQDEHALQEQVENMELPGMGLRWHALAIGDSCLFQIRADRLFEAFPLRHALEFNSRPVLVSSNPTSNARVWEEVSYTEGETQPDDIFFLATDALSQWFLAAHESGKKPWELLCGLKTNDEFASFVSQLREGRLMRNDDTTLLTIRLNEDGAPSVAQAERQSQGEQEAHSACGADQESAARVDNSENVP